MKDLYTNFKGKNLKDIKLPFQCHEILKVLPQKWPLLLVDRVDEINMKRVIATKCNTIGEHSLVGHFPDYPVTPGVSMIESCAQACTLLAYFRDHYPLDHSVTKIGVRMVSLDDVKLRREVLPGDVLRIEASHLSTKNIAGTVFHRFSSVGKVDGKIAIEAKMTGYFFNDIDRK